MQVRRIGYVGMRTDDVDAMTSFFRDVIGLEAAGEGETVTFQRLPTHRRDLLGVYAQDHRDARLIPDDADVVIAFVVDDIREAMAEVQAAGLEIVGVPVWAAEAFRDPTLGEFACSYAPPTVACSRSSRYPTRPRTSCAQEASGTGRAVWVTGFEEWTFGDEGLVAVSRGSYDQDEYDRQLEHGASDT